MMEIITIDIIAPILVITLIVIAMCQGGFPDFLNLLIGWILMGLSSLYFLDGVLLIFNGHIQWHIFVKLIITPPLFYIGADVTTYVEGCFIQGKLEHVRFPVVDTIVEDDSLYKDSSSQKEAE